MDNREYIKRLVSFDDDGMDTSTGFVSAAGNMVSETVDEETSDWLYTGVHRFGSSFYWLHVTETENWRRDVRGVSVEYTNRGNLYIIIDNDEVRADVEIKMTKLEKELQSAARIYGAKPLRNMILVLPEGKRVWKLDLHYTDGFMYNPVKGESFFKNSFYFKGNSQNLPRQVMFTNAYYYMLADDRKEYVIPNALRNMNKTLPVRWWTQNLNEGVIPQNLISFDEEDTSTGYVNVSGNDKLTTVDGVLKELPMFFKKQGVNVWISKPKVEDAGTVYEARYVNVKFRTGPGVLWVTTLGIRDFDNIKSNLEYYANEKPDVLRWQSQEHSTMKPYEIRWVQGTIRDFLNTML